MRERKEDAAAASVRKRRVIITRFHVRKGRRNQLLEGVDCPSEFYRSGNPISVGEQIFLVSPLDLTIKDPGFLVSQIPGGGLRQPILENAG